MLFSLVSAFTVLLLPSLVPPAYLDPGSGSYLLQLLIAGLLGGLFVIRLSWGRIRAFFSRRQPRKEDERTDE